MVKFGRKRNVIPQSFFRFPYPCDFCLLVGNQNIHESVSVDIKDTDPVVTSVCTPKSMPREHVLHNLLLHLTHV